MCNVKGNNKKEKGNTTFNLVHENLEQEKLVTKY